VAVQKNVRLEIPDCPPEAVRALTADLGVSETVAQVLVRRGYTDPNAARAFLAADQTHPPHAFSGIERVLEPILRHIAKQSVITVHGDYDVDGICATTVLVGALRRLGARVDWHIPDRAAGYGLREGAVKALSQRGSSLIITVDCGIASTHEVALARRLGMEVIVTDHHSPKADGSLPDAPLLHPRLCGYPCAELCGTAVAHKLTRALWSASGRDAAELDADLDLVALASVADVVPLQGENRALVRAGLRALAATARPGLRALMEVARVDPARLDTRAIAFGLAPRLNAPGRLYTAAPALELLMTNDLARAAQLAAALERCNSERRHVEQQILFEAEGQLRQLGQMPAYVLAGEGWHPGVVGIVAARIAERANRPAVLVAIDGQSGKGRGSGRSIPAFDLLAGLTACSQHLAAYGGHRAACGLEIDRERLQGFQVAFASHAAAALSEEDLVAVERVDAVVSVRDVGLSLAEELQRLAPFGRGNPSVCLMVKDAEISQVRAMGQGRHARFRVHGDGVHASAVSFGGGARLPIGEGKPVDATFKLEINEWRGVCEPRLVLRHMLRAANPAGVGADLPQTPAARPLQLALAVP
jgi:single-stranded-DNA-specific exonuclease